LAVLDSVADSNAAIGGGVAVAGEVEFGSLAVAEFVKESYVDVGKSSGGTCFG